jgi:hypothetical protein
LEGEYLGGLGEDLEQRILLVLEDLEQGKEGECASRRRHWMGERGWEEEK